MLTSFLQVLRNELVDVRRQGKGGAFNRADSIADILISERSAFPEATWLKGANLVYGGFISEGLRLLDSLRQNAEFESDTFEKDLMRMTALVFLPTHIRNHFDSISVLQLENAAPQTFYFNKEETIPVQKGWTITPVSSKDKALPSIAFSEKYKVKENFSLQFPTLSGQSTFQLPLDINPEISKDIPSKLIHNPDGAGYDLDMKVLIDCAAAKPPLHEVLRQITHNNFDIVKPQTEKQIRGSLSIRCYNKRVFRNVPGQYFAYVVFDKVLRPSFQFPSRSKKKQKEQEALQVRYLIAIRSSQAVEEKAEFALQTLLDRFERM